MGNVQNKLKSRLYVLQNLSEDENNQILKEIYSINAAIFSDFQYDTHKIILAPANAKKTYILVCSNARNICIGYFTIQLFFMNFQGKKFLIFRDQTGILKDYRRKIGSIYLLSLLFVYYRCRYAFTPMWGFLIIQNPKVYLKVRQLMYDFYPKNGMSNLQTGFTEALLAYFHLTKPDPKYPWSLYIGPIVKFSTEERSALQKSQDLGIQYFFEQNPRMDNGFGLLTLIPYNWKNILLSSFKVVSYLLLRMKRQLF